MGTKSFATLVRFGSRANLVCVFVPGCHQKDKGRDSVVLDTYVLPVLWLFTVLYTRLRYGLPQLHCTCTCTHACTRTSSHEEGLVCSRRAQSSDPCGPPSHRQYLWG